MSVTGLSSDPNRLCKNSSHWRNNSGELDVFEATRYFSGANDHNPGYNSSSTFPQNFAGENSWQHGQRAARMSLDMPMTTRNPMNSDTNLPMMQKQMKENKKYKQPSSPGGRLASFLNSLFNQTASKKKKKKSKSSMKDEYILEQESPGGRKRRSSISHFRITTANDSNSSSSGFVTPPVYAKTPTKSSYKEIQRLSDHQKTASVHKNGANEEKRSTDYSSWLDEEFRFSNGNVFKNNGSFRNSATNWIAADEERGFRKFCDVDDGVDTDSSSDLFDLPNHDLDLPVYGTTHMDRIGIGAPISSAATV